MAPVRIGPLMVRARADVAAAGFAGGLPASIMDCGRLEIGAELMGERGPLMEIAGRDDPFLSSAAGCLPLSRSRRTKRMSLPRLGCSVPATCAAAFTRALRDTSISMRIGKP